jgi:hypothetical protein
VNRWPARPETLVDRFERAVRAHVLHGALPPEAWGGIQREYEKCRRELLARIIPATSHQATRRLAK